MIIVEGVDHVGKTTLVNALAGLMRKQAKHAAGPSQCFFEGNLVQKWSQLPPSFNYCHDYLRACDRDQSPICDRFVASELAYGPVYRGHVHPRFDSHAQRQVARALNSRGAMHVRVHAAWNIVKARLDRVPDELVKHESHFRQLTLEFDRVHRDNLALGEHGTFWLPASKPWLRPGLNTSEGGFKRTYAFAQAALREWQMQQVRADQFHALRSESWGTLQTDKVLLVGEQVNLNRMAPDRGWREMPFSGPGPSSRMVTRLLDAAHVGEREVHLVNAYKVNGDRMDGALVEFLRPSAIIPLGEAAGAVVQELGFAHLVSTDFPHPQWISRFRSKEFHRYGEKLAAAMRVSGS